MIAGALLLVVGGWVLGSITMLMFLWYRVETARINTLSQVLVLRQQLAAERARKAERLEVHLKQQRSNGAISNQRVIYFDALDSRDALGALRRAYWLEQRGELFSTRNMTQLLSRNQFEQFRDELLKRELLTWNGNDPRAGVTWTDQGRAVLETAAGI